MPMGIPGCPELAFCTASIASARTALVRFLNTGASKSLNVPMNTNSLVQQNMAQKHRSSDGKGGASRQNRYYRLRCADRQYDKPRAELKVIPPEGEYWGDITGKHSAKKVLTRLEFPVSRFRAGRRLIFPPISFRICPLHSPPRRARLWSGL